MIHRALLLILLPTTCLAQHELLLQAGGELTILAADGKLEWQMPWSSSSQLHALPNGNIMLLRGGHELVEIEKSTRRVVWTFDSSGLSPSAEESQAMLCFEPLENGNILISTEPGDRLVEIDRLGSILREVSLPAPSTAAPRIGLLENGNLLLPEQSEGLLRELDGQTGEVVWEYRLPHEERTERPSSLAAARLSSGNTLIASEGEVLLREITPQGELVWTLEQTELPQLKLSNIVALQVLPGGSCAIEQRLAPAGKTHIVEVDRESRTVSWELESLERPPSVAILLDIEPDAELRRRARRIHRDTLTLDTHKDISVTLADPNYPEDPAEAARARLSQDPTLWGTNQVDFPKMRAGGLDAAFYIVYVGQGALDEEGYAMARKIALSKFETIERMARRYPGDIEIARSPDDVERIHAAGKLVACIGIENGYAMGTDLTAIEEFHERGARYMSLTHNRHSQLGDSNTPEGEPIHGGLSELGRQAIEEMNRVGIMVDISHAGEETTMQAIAHSRAPVIASHSSVDGVLEHGRNLSDRELLALKENGGVLQTVAFATYVRSNDARAAFIQRTRRELGLDTDTARPGGTPEMRQELRKRVRAFDASAKRANVADFVDHIDYAVELIGIDHVAISSDFDGGGGVEGWDDASETFNLTLELLRRGYTEEEIAKLWSGNTLRVWRAVEAIAEQSRSQDE